MVSVRDFIEFLVGRGDAFAGLGDERVVVVDVTEVEGWVGFVLQVKGVQGGKIGAIEGVRRLVERGGGATVAGQVLLH